MSLRMRRLSMLAASLLGTVTVLTACHDKNSGSNPTSPIANMTGFDGYAQQLVQMDTCETNDAFMTNTLNFTFAADQDTVPTPAVDGLVAGCTA